MKTQLGAIIKALFPIPLYFLIGFILQTLLKKYTVVGPVDSITGQPIFSNFSATLYYTLIALMTVGFIYTTVQSIKSKGWIRYGSLVAAVLFLPLQYIFIIFVQITLFGK